MSTTSTAIYSNPLFATYSVYARNASIESALFAPPRLLMFVHPTKILK